MLRIEGKYVEESEEEDPGSPIEGGEKKKVHADSTVMTADLTALCMHRNASPRSLDRPMM